MIDRYLTIRKMKKTFAKLSGLRSLRIDPIRPGVCFLQVHRSQQLGTPQSATE
jgi:hypothetical protein